MELCWLILILPEGMILRELPPMFVIIPQTMEHPNNTPGKLTFALMSMD